MENILTINELSRCELKVMQAIWLYNSDIRRIDIEKILRDEFNINWNSSTLLTFLSRLRNKGMITSKREGRHTYWVSTVSIYEYRKFVTLNLIDNFYQDKLELMEVLLNME